MDMRNFQSKIESDNLLFEAGEPESADLVKYRFYAHVCNRIAAEMAENLDKLRVDEIPAVVSGSITQLFHGMTRNEDGSCNEQAENVFLSKFMACMMETIERGH